jgi:hypothetical protein
VREVEQRARAAGKGRKDGEGDADVSRRDGRPPEVRRMEDELRRYLQTDVQLAVAGRERGAITIQFYSADDLERIMELVLREQRERY